tara:strand:+ start:1143 stop:1382 length:240 start_codon:yes stop_codon:yes gene_type:complete
MLTETSADNPHQLLSLSQAANYLKMSRSWLYHQVEVRAIPHIRLGSAIRFDLEALHQWLEQRNVSARVTRKPEETGSWQ